MDVSELRIRSRSFLKLCGGIVLFNILTLASNGAELFLTLPKPIGMVFSVVGFAGVFALLAATLAPLAALGMCVVAIFRRDVRPALPAILVLGFFAFATTVPSGIAGFKIWDAGFRNLACKSSPLVQAIRKYESDHGKPPPDLAAIVREKYLTEIPSTPCGCSEYRYELNDHGNPWTLTVIPPSRGVGFDRFDYWPKQDYPERDSGGSWERMGDWAYYHE
ncbi:MAG: hypothetical protein K8T20_00790 [Planctomycetes bacterium]|nr:hypothetical protein [Planctomycetota bacterium]